MSIPKDPLQNGVDIIKKKHCINGAIILNTNLEQLGIVV